MLPCKDKKQAADFPVSSYYIWALQSRMGVICYTKGNDHYNPVLEK